MGLGVAGMIIIITSDEMDPQKFPA
jgi:hypothetical protein